MSKGTAAMRLDGMMNLSEGTTATSPLARRQVHHSILVRWLGDIINLFHELLVDVMLLELLCDRPMEFFFHVQQP